MKKSIIAVAVIAFIGIGIYLLTASQQKIEALGKNLAQKIIYKLDLMLMVVLYPFLTAMLLISNGV